jgi:tetratricopeptide (TPR) repeat protein
MTDELRITRGRALAILGRTNEALEILGPCNESNSDRWLLEGTIRENRGEWDLGSLAYVRAATQLLAGPKSQRSRLIQAVRGNGYCKRKAGRYREAEAAYLHLLSLAPTAESHFLAAQFYEDAQSTSSALRHARQAMALDPDRYGEQGRKLVDKLQTLHFGCWGVYSGAP